MSEEKNKVGRPTKYRPEYCEYLKQHLAKGLSYEIFGACLPDYGAKEHVAKSTVEDWEKKYPDFQGAKKEGWQLCQAFWEKKGIDHITHTRDGRQLNSTAWIFNMKNRFGWTDKTEMKVQEENQKPKRTFAFDLARKPEEVDGLPDNPNEEDLDEHPEQSA